MACGAQSPAVTAPNEATPTSTAVDTKPKATPASIITTACVLHAGSAQGHSDSSGKKSGSCDYGAECVATPGKSAAGDGDVGLKCEDASCSCSWYSIVDDRMFDEPFTLAEPCMDADVAKQVFMEHCMKGLKLYVGPAAAPPP